MMFYLDTNVFISRYKPDDPYHSSSKRILAGLEAGSLRACTSPLTVLETACVTSRTYESRPGFASENGSKARGSVISALLKRLARLNLVFVHPPGDARFPVGECAVLMPAIFHLALNLSYKLGLRTLDCVHLAALMYSRSVLDEEVSFFVTADSDILERRRELREMTGCTFADPDEFARLAGL
jgi:predicted nucleic acid-binding protein